MKKWNTQIAAAYAAVESAKNRLGGHFPASVGAVLDKAEAARLMAESHKVVAEVKAAEAELARLVG